MKKWGAFFSFLLICNLLSAQGWVTDEASKDDSGGVFSGIFGLAVLLGFIWIISYFMDKISEYNDSKNRKISRRNQSDLYPGTGNNLIQKNRDANNLGGNKKNDLSKEHNSENNKNLYSGGKIDTEEKQISQLSEFDHANNLGIELNQDNLIEIIRNNYVLSEISKKDCSGQVIVWGERLNNELETPSLACYTSDLKKLLTCYVSEYEIKDGVEIIADNCFMGLTRCNIELPSSVKILGNMEFYKCNLQNFVIPPSVKILTGNPFVRCSVRLLNKSPYFELIDGVLYDKNRKIIISVLWNTAKSDYNIRTSVTIIGRYAFYGLNLPNIAKIKLPHNVEYICESAFAESSFSEIDLYYYVKEIDDNAFRNSRLVIFNLPNSLCKLGKSAFEGCTNLEAIVISNGLKVIEENTFLGCLKLNHVEIPWGVESIEKNSFKDCSSLSSIRFPRSLKRIKRHAFIGCPLIKVQLYKSTKVYKDAFPPNCDILYID